MGYLPVVVIVSRVNNSNARFNLLITIAGAGGGGTFKGKLFLFIVPGRL